MSQPLRQFELASRLPFSRKCSAGELNEIAQRAADALGLRTAVISPGTARCGLEMERRFRICWWSGHSEQFRARLHDIKKEVYQAVRLADCQTGFEQAWREMNVITSSASWRKHLRLMTEGRCAEADWFRLAFRIAGQAWSRAARWNAVMPSSCDSPITPILELVEAGAVPVGCHGDSLVVFELNCNGEDECRFGPTLPQLQAVSRTDVVFLAASFRRQPLLKAWRGAFEDRGWNVYCERVPENEAIEPQLGQRIRESLAVVGLAGQKDPAPGLPWWVYQELDYALECRKPTGLISDVRGIVADLRNVVEIGPTSFQGSVTNDHPVWEWLARIPRE